MRSGVFGLGGPKIANGTQHSKKQQRARVVGRAMPCEQPSSSGDNPCKATNISWHQTSVTRQSKEELLGQRGVVVWFTGLSGSGKSTVACLVEHALSKRGRLTALLDGDNLRHGLNCNLGFCPADREENIRRVRH